MPRFQNKTFERLAKAADANPLVAAFVVDAVCKLMKQLDQPGVKEEFEKNCGMISYNAWVASGKSAISAIDGK
jgi:hypothetical protein